jgi:hypothetical protein
MVTPESTVTVKPLDRLILLVVLALSAVMLGWMTQSLWTGKVPFTGDLLHFHYPLRDFYAGALSSGQSFDWMPTLFTGFHVVGEGQLGAYHPLHWLLYRYVPLNTAFAIELVGAYPFLFGGTWLLLRRWTTPGAAAFGAMLFTFCGFNLSHGVHVNMVAVVAHTPWLLWAIHQMWTSTKWQESTKNLGIISLLTGSQLLLGHPQGVWFSGLIEASYLGLLMTNSPRPSWLHKTGTWATAKVLGLAIGAVQVLATLHAVRQSNRSFDFSFSTSFALPPTQLLQLLEPYLNWSRVLRWTEVAGDELAAYGGAVALVLAAWWLASYLARRTSGETTAADRLGLGALVFGLFGLWLALGADGGLYLLQTNLPLVGQFRAPARYVLFTQLALAIIAALAMLQLSRATSPGGQRDPGTLWAPWGLVAVSTLVAVWWTLDKGQSDAMGRQAVLAVTLGPLLFAAAAGLLTLAVRGIRWAVIGLVLLAAGDQALYGLGGVIAWQDYLTPNTVSELLAAETKGLVPRGPARIARGGNPNIWVLDGYHTLEGYAAIAPRKLLDYRSPQALQVARVEYVHADLQRLAKLPNTEQLTDYWYQIPEPVARARLVTESRVSQNPNVDLSSLDVERVALTTHDLSLPPGTAGNAEIVFDEPGDIRVVTTTETRQLLIVSEGFDEGWTATVDGQSVSVERVYGDFIGSVVPAGQHEVALRFRPGYVPASRIISLFGGALALFLATGLRVRKR